MVWSNPKYIVMAVGALAVTAGICLVVVRLCNARAYHFVEVRSGVLYRDGMRHPLQFLSSCDKGKIRTVVSLIGDDEIVSERFAPAIAECRNRGIKTLRVTIPLGGWPASEDVRKFLELVGDAANQPVLAHCREGVRRTGMMVSAYRMSVMGMSKEQAKAALETFGHSRRSIGDIERFIDAYDPATKTVTYGESVKAASDGPNE